MVVVIRGFLVAILAACHTAAPRPPTLADRVHAQEHVVTAFFGGRLEPYDLVIVPTRAEMTRVAAARWHVPELPCFAVAMGTGSTLLLLDPAVWNTEACDHATDSAVAIDRVIAHELVHVYQGQHRPADRELDHADDVGWFVEGLATYASGQLDAAREAQAVAAIRDGSAPAKLADAWTGKARYAIAGSIVRTIEQRFGRPMLARLLTATTTAELLATLQISEQQLLEAWRASLSR